MRVLLYVIIILSTLLAPVERLDVAKLEPVEAVAIYTEQNEVVILTDTGSMGRGETAHDAVKNLKDAAAAVIYLDTAEYLLTATGAEEHAQQVLTYFKPSVQVGEYHGGDVKEEAKYLDAHQQTGTPKTD